jgi:hypothetical protein
MTAIIYIYDLGETTMSNCISIYYVPGRLKAEYIAASRTNFTGLKHSKPTMRNMGDRVFDYHVTM